MLRLRGPRLIYIFEDFSLDADRRELLAARTGALALEDATRLAKIATRQYTKRQMTWIRGRMKEWEWVEGDAEAVLKCLAPFHGVTQNQR